LNDELPVVTEKMVLNQVSNRRQNLYLTNRAYEEFGLDV